MKKILYLLIITIFISSTMVAFGDNSLDGILNNTENQVQEYENESSEIITELEHENKADVYNENKSFIEGLQGSANVSADVEGVSNITSGAKTVVAFIVQVIAYLITILLALRVVIDLAFIALPFARSLWVMDILEIHKQVLEVYQIAWEWLVEAWECKVLV